MKRFFGLAVMVVVLLLAGCSQATHKYVVKARVVGPATAGLLLVGFGNEEDRWYNMMAQHLLMQNFKVYPVSLLKKAVLPNIFQQGEVTLRYRFTVTNTLLFSEEMMVKEVYKQFIDSLKLDFFILVKKEGNSLYVYVIDGKYETVVVQYLETDQEVTVSEVCQKILKVMETVGSNLFESASVW